MTDTMPHIAGIDYYPSFLAEAESSEFFNRLEASLNWQEETIKMYGKPVKVPRLVCWYGDKNVEYRYSGVTHFGSPWLPDLLDLKNRIEKLTHATFNSVLGNYYRNELDSMGWHADNEKELGTLPCIASLSLGESRLFTIRNNKTGDTRDITLTNGSLLVMSGNFQNEWKHSVPKTKSPKKPRINLTYRYIFPK